MDGLEDRGPRFTLLVKAADWGAVREVLPEIEYLSYLQAVQTRDRGGVREAHLPHPRGQAQPMLRPRHLEGFFCNFHGC